jgi:hypothetical protein
MPKEIAVKVCDTLKSRVQAIGYCRYQAYDGDGNHGFVVDIIVLWRKDDDVAKMAGRE